MRQLSRSKKSIILVAFALFAQLMQFEAHAADSTINWTQTTGNVVSAPAGDALFNLTLPADFVPTSVHFSWAAGTPKVTTLDGQSTNTTLSLTPPELDGFIRVKISPSGRNATVHIYSMLAVQVTTQIVVTDSEASKGKSISTSITAKFAENSNSDTTVAKIPVQDEIKVDINNPKTNGSPSTKVSIAISKDSPSSLQNFNPNLPNFGRSYSIQRVTSQGQPLGVSSGNTDNTGSEQKWFQVAVTQDNYLASGLVFRVFFSQAIPQFTGFGGNALSRLICEEPGVCGNSAYDSHYTVLWVKMYKDFNVTVDFAKQPNKASNTNGASTDVVSNQIKALVNSFRWSPYHGVVLTNSSANPMKISTYGNADADGVYFYYRADITNFPTGALCLDTEPDLQYLDGSKWTSVWSDPNYKTLAQSSFYEPLGTNPHSICLDDSEYSYTNSYDRSQVGSFSDNPGLPLPDLNYGEHRFRIVLKNQFRSTDTKIGSPFDAISTVFRVKYVPTPVTPKLNVSVTYPRIVVLGKTYKATAKTTPASSGTCSYYLSNGVRVFIGSAALKKGTSTFSFPAMSSNPNSGQLASLTVVCTAGNLSGTGGTYFLSAQP
jgi:hypothetical protein